MKIITPTRLPQIFRLAMPDAKVDKKKKISKGM